MPAYDDAAGVTAAFNQNVLGCSTSGSAPTSTVDAFEHVAVWDAEQRVDRDAAAGDSRRRDVRIDGLDLGCDIRGGRGDAHRDLGEVPPGRGSTAELAAAGFAPRGWWTDEREWFSVSLWGVG